MAETERALDLSEAYQEELAQQYGPDIVEQINDSIHYAPLPWGGTDETIPYLRLPPAGEPINKRPALYVPGFTEDPLAKLPFAAEMAQRGVDLIIPGKNRAGMLRDATNRKSATHSEAMNNLAILKQEGLLDGEIDVIVHSYGALIFQAMHRIVKAGDLETFKDSKLAMLAPAGTNHHEWLLSLGIRFGAHMVAENFTKKDFHDVGGDMLKAGFKNLTANIPRTAREVWELARLRVDYRELAASDLGAIMVLGYGDDWVYPHRVMRSTMADAVEAGVGYATPISLRPRSEDDKRIRGRNGASHNDEQFNPERPAGSIVEFLNAA